MLGRRDRRPPPPVGVVLAGGQGRRLGGDKAVVALDGRPLLEFPLRVLQRSVRDVAVVAKRDTVLPPLESEVPVWLEPDEPQHPLAGVVHALRCAEGRPVLVVAVDLPLLDVAVPRALARRPAGRHPAVVARAGGRLQPLLARYEPAALPALEGFDPSARAVDLVAALDPLVLDVRDEEQLLNVNRPEDLLRASALVRERLP
jgi:molybdopterin-guanine dinucleotide biosynthesis protein A